MKKKLLVSFTSAWNPDWHQTILDLKKFGINEFGLFLTTVGDSAERWEIFQEIKSIIPDAKIPLVHIRPDMAPDELGFLIDNFGTEYVNIHPVREYPLVHDYSQYKDKILVENAGPAIENGLEVSDVEDFAGICLDFAHLERSRLKKLPAFDITKNTIKKFKILANHLSAVSAEPVSYGGATHSYDVHKYTSLSQFDYLKHCPSEYFSPIICLELMNSIEEQLKAKEYIESIIGDKLSFLA